MSKFEVGIIGGGPAGLTAAATLARQLHTAVVFDSGNYRNGNTTHMHIVPTWDHKDPKEFREETRSQIEANYSTIQFTNVAVSNVEKKSDSCFVISDLDGKVWEVKKLILAIGSSDMLPDIEGYSKLWKKKIYHCLFCLGYEDRGAEASGVLVVQGPVMMPAFAVHMADNAAQLSKEVTIFTNGSEEVEAQLKTMTTNSPFKIESRHIAQLVNSNVGVDVMFTNDDSKKVSFLVHNPLTYPQGQLSQQLELKLSPTGDIQADAPAYQTSSHGVFAAGDCISPFKVVPQAIASGNFAAVAAATQLQAEKYNHFSLA